MVVALALVVPAASEESNGFILLPPDEMKAQQAIMERCQGGSSEWFSVGAMFVAFREALEACVIISVSANDSSNHCTLAPCRHPGCLLLCIFL